MSTTTNAGRTPAGAVNGKSAVIYRLVMPKHLCPFGLKSLDLLQREGFAVEDHWLMTPEQTDAFKARHEVERGGCP